MNLKQVKNKITSTKKIGQVTKALESVSAVKMRKSQSQVRAGRPYIRAAMHILAEIANHRDVSLSPFTKKRDLGQHILVLVTSDKGLVGSVNSAVLREATRALSTLSPDEVEVVCIGKKAVDFADRQALTVLDKYVSVSDDVTLSDVQSISDLLNDRFLSEKYKEISVIYQNFISTFEQKPIRRTILPLVWEEIREIARSVSEKDAEDWLDVAGSPTHEIEPSADEVLSSLVPSLVQVILYHALSESKASEHSARMIAMKNATDKSQDIIEQLSSKYNKTRQAAVTAEVSEITASLTATE